MAPANEASKPRCGLSQGGLTGSDPWVVWGWACSATAKPRRWSKVRCLRGEAPSGKKRQ